jgi:hypothetical protein
MRHIECVIPTEAQRSGEPAPSEVEWGSAVAAAFAFAVAFAAAYVVPLPFAIAIAAAVAVGIEPGFSPASKPAAKRPPLCRRLERSPKGEATDSIAVVLAVVF